MNNIFFLLALLITLLVFYYEREKSGPYKGDPSIARDIKAEYIGCKELDALPPKQFELELRGTTPKSACQKLFFESRKIDKLSTFLPAKSFKAYNENLSKNECLKAEQILWQHYKTTYPDAPQVNFSSHYDEVRGKWRFYVLALQVPETHFCIYKKIFETNQKQIQTRKVLTTPITDLFKIHQIKSTNDFERLRNKGLMRIVNLMRLDYAPAQVLIIKQSMKGDIFTLVPSEQYRLLKRLEMFGKLTKELEAELEKAKGKISEKEAKAIDKKRASYSFFLIQSMPTTAKKLKRPSTP